MNRLTNATRATDLFGVGKHGYTNGVPGTIVPTILDSAAMNPIQEELARAIEGFGVALNAGDLAQLSAILLTITKDVKRPNAGDPVFSSFHQAHEHPGNTANRWKLQLSFPLAVGGRVRVFSGEGAVNDLSAWAITVNASWNPVASGSGGQVWTKDDTARESNLLRGTFGALQFYGRIAGAGSWGDTAWDTERGTLDVGFAIGATTITSTGLITAGNGLTVSAGTTTLRDTDILTNLDVTADIRSGGNYKYLGAAPLREWVYTMSGGDCINNFEYVGATETISTTGDAGSAIYTKPIFLPSGALIHEVLVQGHRNTSTLLVKLNRWVQTDWGAAPAAGSGVNIGQTSITSTTLATTVADCGDYLVDNAVEAYSLQVTCSTSSATGDVMERFKIRFYDPGPRNF